jgi:hypothetical protein
VGCPRGHDGLQVRGVPSKNGSFLAVKVGVCTGEQGTRVRGDDVRPQYRRPERVEFRLGDDAYRSTMSYVTRL